MAGYVASAPGAVRAGARLAAWVPQGLASRAGKVRPATSAWAGWPGPAPGRHVLEVALELWDPYGAGTYRSWASALAAAASLG